MAIKIAKRPKKATFVGSFFYLFHFYHYEKVFPTLQGLYHG
jgi:hypothetical protein